jgi:type I restriction enzyme M protein
MFYLLNTNFVQKQIRKYTFIQGTISTVGDRFYELYLPIHTTVEKIKQISDEVKSIIDTKRALRERIENLIS